MNTKLLSIAILVSLVGYGCDNKQPPETQKAAARNPLPSGLSLTLKEPNHSYKSAEEVNIDCVFANNTPKQVKIVLRSLWHFWQLRVVGDGAETFIFPGSTPPGLSETEIINLSPGKSYSFQLNISNGVNGLKWKLKSPGTYHVSLKYELNEKILGQFPNIAKSIPDMWTGIVESNRIVVHLAP